MKRILAAGVFTLIPLLAASSQSQPDVTEAKLEETGSLDQLDWLIGHWRGEGFGGTFDEVWLPATAESMLGAFRLAVKDKIVFYELITLTLEDGRPLMRLKHFDSRLIGWEEKDKATSFAFVSAAEKELRLDGITYRRVADDTLKIEMNTLDDDGTVESHVFTCWRVDSK